MGQISVVDYLVLDADPHLLGTVCTQCGAIYLGRRNACGKCEGTEFTTKKLSNEGTLKSFSIVHRAPPGIPTPFVSCIVALDGGGIVKTNLEAEPDPDKIKLNSHVKLCTRVVGKDDEGTEAVAFAYRLA